MGCGYARTAQLAVAEAPTGLGMLSRFQVSGRRGHLNAGLQAQSFESAAHPSQAVEVTRLLRTRGFDFPDPIARGGMRPPLASQ
jgi:hypothetical protein